MLQIIENLVPDAIRQARWQMIAVLAVALAGTGATLAMEAPAQTQAFKVRILTSDAGAADASAWTRLGVYYNALTERLRAVPGLTLLPHETAGVPGFEEAAARLGVDDADFEIRVSLGDDGKAVNFEASPLRQPGRKLVSGTDPDMLPGSSTFFRPSRVRGFPTQPDDPDRSMENLVERMRMELFPRDRARVDQWLSELRDPRLESAVRLAALNKLQNDSRRDAPAGRGGFPADPYRPDPALVAAASEFAMAAKEPATRIRVWQSFRLLQLVPRIDLSAFVAPALQALAAEPDAGVQLEVVTVLGISLASPGVRAALEAVVASDRQEVVRMAARRVLEGNAGWNEYLVVRLEDPQVPDSARLDLMRHVYSATGGNASGQEETAMRLNEASVRSLGRLVKNPGSSEVRHLAAQLLHWAGENRVVREVFIDFLQSSAGQPATDNELRRRVLRNLTMGTRLLGMALQQDVRPTIEQISARDPDPELREIARLVLLEADTR